MERERVTPTWLARTLDWALWALVFLLPIKFGGLVIIPNRPENFLEWWLSSWPAQIAVAAALVWMAAEAVANRKGCLRAVRTKARWRGFM